MTHMVRPYLIYGAMIFVAVLVHATSTFGGIIGCLFSIVGMIFSRTIVFLVLSFLNFSLSLAFDNFIRVDPVFYFYRGDASGVTDLSLVSLVVYCFIGILDATRKSGKFGYFLIDFEFLSVSRLMFWPCAALTIGTALFIIKSESFVLSSAYDAYELQKYPFLEYMSLVIAFMIQSLRYESKIKIFISYLIATFFVFVMIATSYRMVGIICTLCILVFAFNRKRISKALLVGGWLLAYVGLTYISYWRIGNDEITLGNIFGYVNGRMDNTFTGVIETAMAYIQISHSQRLDENIAFLIGVLLPIPNSLIPDNMLYLIDAQQKYSFPGGGALAGFIIYFNYLLAVPYAIYLTIAFTRSNQRPIAAGMYLIVIITITRWWLYGPYVIFKFFGVFMLLAIFNEIARHIIAKPKANSMFRYS